MGAKFITFEGPEGSGKSTHSKLLCRWLKENNIDFIHTREPGGTEIGEKIRKILLDPKNKISPLAEMFLYQAARAKIVEEVIEPALKKGRSVICDRFLDATLVYQGYAGCINTGLIERLGKLAIKGIMPHLTLLMDIDTEKGMRRSVRDGADRMEQKPLSYHKKVRRGYLTLAKKYPKRIKLIRVKDNINKTQEMVRKQVLRCLGLK
ncbi:MAG: dTMP kinase [Candidatus Omnitrophota bacterium]